MSSMPTPECSRTCRPHAAIAGEPSQAVALANEPVVVRAGHGVGKDPQIARDAGRLRRRDRAQDESRALVHVDVGRHQLAVGERHHPVSRLGAGDLVGRRELARPGVGIPGSHIGEAPPEPPESLSIAIEREPARRTDRVLEERVVVDRHHQSGGQLARMARVEVHADHPVGLARGRIGPARGDALAHQLDQRVHGLGPDDHGAADLDRPGSVRRYLRAAPAELLPPSRVLAVCAGPTPSISASALPGSPAGQDIESMTPMDPIPSSTVAAHRARRRTRPGRWPRASDPTARAPTRDR